MQVVLKFKDLRLDEAKVFGALFVYEVLCFY